MTEYKALRLTGRCANGGELDGGRLFHAVKEHSYAALCGAKPGRRSVGWSLRAGEAVTCKRCLNRMKRNSITISAFTNAKDDQDCPWGDTWDSDDVQQRH